MEEAEQGTLIRKHATGTGHVADVMLYLAMQATQKVGVRGPGGTAILHQHGLQEVCLGGLVDALSDDG